MDNKMFCYQCEQTAGCTGCTRESRCRGKTSDVAHLQDELTGALIGLARSTDGDTQATSDTWRLMIEGLFTTVTKVTLTRKRYGKGLTGTRRKETAGSQLLRLQHLAAVETTITT